MHKPSLTESNSEPHVMQKICQQQKVFSREKVLPCKANFLSREKALSRASFLTRKYRFCRVQKVRLSRDVSLD